MMISSSDIVVYFQRNDLFVYAITQFIGVVFGSSLKEKILNCLTDMMDVVRCLLC
jgi:hypothetical protein